jgi:hypothetical protein
MLTEQRDPCHCRFRIANAAISRFGGNDQGDTNGGGAWGFPTPIIED